MREKILQLLSEEWGTEAKETDSFKSMDSLEFLDMMLSFSRVGINVPEDKWKDISTVADLIREAK